MFSRLQSFPRKEVKFINYIKIIYMSNYRMKVSSLYHAYLVHDVELAYTSMYSIEQVRNVIFLISIDT